MKGFIRLGVVALGLGAVLAFARVAGKGAVFGDGQDYMLMAFAGFVCLSAITIAAMQAVHHVRERVRETRREEDEASLSLSSPIADVRGEGLVRLIMALRYRFSVLISAYEEGGSAFLSYGMFLLLVSIAVAFVWFKWGV